MSLAVSGPYIVTAKCKGRYVGCSFYLCRRAAERAIERFQRKLTPGTVETEIFDLAALIECYLREKRKEVEELTRMFGK